MPHAKGAKGAKHEDKSPSLYALRVSAFSLLSDDINGVGGYPDVDLPKSGFHPLLESREELAIFRTVSHISKNADQFVVKLGLLVLPNPTNDLGFPRYRTKSVAQFGQGFADHGPGHRTTVIEPQREQDFVATPFAHRWQAPGP
jgi:hypothetical protein